MALLEDHLAKFHKMTDAKEMWDAIKSRFSEYDESKKMQKYILKQQFEGFSVFQHKRAFIKAMKGSQNLLTSVRDSWRQEEGCMEFWSKQGLGARTGKIGGTLSIDLDTETQPSESESQSSEFDTCESNISTEPSELVSELVVNESNVECQPNVWSDAPIIEEYKSDSEDEYVSIPIKEKETPSFANQQVKTPRETHVLNNGWNNVQRVNKQNQFVPSAVLTRTGKIPVSTARASGTKKFMTARQSFNRQTVLTSAAMEVNTIKPTVNRVRLANVFHKTHSPFSRPFKKTIVLRTDFSKQKVNTTKVNAVSTVGGKKETAVKPSAGTGCIGDKRNKLAQCLPEYKVDPVLEIDYPHRALKNKGIVDSGCSRHMTGNKAYLAEFQDFNGGPVAFGGSKGYITGKGKIKTGKLDFEDVCFVKELQHFNLFSVSQMCDKKNKVLFTDSECLVLSPEFKLPDENQVLLKIPRQNNMYSFNLENIVPSGGLACLIAKATTDESNKWHRRLGHVNFKNLNKLVKGNLVRGKGPTWLFDLDYLTNSMNYHPIRSENQANIHACQQEANHHAGTKDIIDAGDSEKKDESAQDCFVLPIWPSYSSTIPPDLKTDEKREGPREEEQVFLDDLERLKRQEKEANEEAEALRKQYAQENENLVIQAGAAKASSTNLVNTVSIPVSTASPHEGLSLSDPTNPKQDDSDIPPLEEIYQNSSDGIFTTSSYDDEGAVADFANLETVVNVSPIPTSRIISSHPSALILGDPTSAIQIRSKVNKSSEAHAFVSYVQKQRRH
ncbi:ribonuclease H-like domain-containing protein, partial [Tanacetum coccineum]